MKLEELKYLWNEDASLEAERLNEAQIGDLLKSRSQSAMSKINRNIVMEMLVVALFGVLWIYMLLSEPTAPHLAEIVAIFAYVIGSGVFYALKFRSLNKPSLHHGDLRTGLSGWTRIMDRYMKFYYWTGIFLIPVLGTAGILYGFHKGLMDNGIAYADVSLYKWSLLGGTILILNLLGLWLIPRFVRWYLRKIYGVHIDELKACLQELEEE